MKKNRLELVVGGLLGIVTVILYWRMTGYGFTNVDDSDYITENPHVLAGLTWSGVQWAFTSGDACNWHPLTWISHMLDCQLFGLKAGGHHFINLIFHVANTLLLFTWLRRVTGALWPSAFVAALFAWHPLHVESVAWTSERKDMLSTFFWLLTMLAYLRYVRARGLGNYLLVLVLFACGLMSKPMVVTLPCVLLLMDFWPLNRWQLPGNSFSAGGSNSVAVSLADAIRNGGQLVIEKIPLFVLAAASCVITFIVQKSGGAVSSIESIGFLARTGNALTAYVRYMGKAVWPMNLSPIYPFTRDLPIVQVLGALVVIIALSVWFVLRAKRNPYLLVGWLWFVGTLVPTIGLVQVGSQSMADRYMYIPSIGFFILLAWGAPALFRIAVQPERVWGALAGIALLGCLVTTWFQLGYWSDPVLLNRHAVEVDPKNYIAYNYLGRSLQDKGKGWYDLALSSYAESVKLKPHYVEGQYNYGTVLMEMGKLDEAIDHLKIAVETDPKYAKGHVNLGSAYFRKGQFSKAEAHFTQALAIRPEDASAHYNLGTLKLAESKLDEAVAQFSEAIRLKPNYVGAHANLAVAFARMGKGSEAISHFSEVVRLQPQNVEAHFNLGLALLEQSKAAEAETQFAECLRLKPGETRSHFRIAVALSRQGKAAQAVVHYREALRLTPDFPEAQNELALILSTSSDAGTRDGKEAVRLAERACELTKRTNAEMLNTLAAAYAEVSRFSDAVATAEAAEKRASESGQTKVAERAAHLVKLFQSGQPLRE